MSDTDLTPELEKLIADAMKARKPYLIGLEEEVQKVQHGKIELTVEIRNGSVDKMQFKSTRSWIREKEGGSTPPIVPLLKFAESIDTK